MEIKIKRVGRIWNLKIFSEDGQLLEVGNFHKVRHMIQHLKEYMDTIEQLA